MTLDATAEIAEISARPRPLSERDLGRLAVLRHEVARSRVTQTHSLMPPAPGEDLFEGVKGVPEISRADLTARHLACGLRHHGALLVRGLVATPDVERLRSLIDGIDRGMPLCPQDATGEPLPGSTPMKCSAAALQGLVEAYQNAGMAALMRDYLGEPPVLLSERLQVDRQTFGKGLTWHQDGAFFGGNVGAVNSFLALAPCGVNAAGLTVAAHRFNEVVGVETGERANLNYGSSLTDQQVREMAGPDSVVTPALEAGDAILIDEMTMHRTGRPPKTDPQPRSWAITWFFAPSRFPAQRHPLWFG